LPVDQPAVDPRPPAGLLDGAPPYRWLDLPGRGSLVVRDSGPSPDRPDAPVVILLHGWWVDADLNWCRTYAALSDRHRVVALDHRGHGAQGLRTRRRFRLEDCADDVVAVADALGIGRFTVVGYSMGGAVAQLVQLRHPGRTAAMVLCATAAWFAPARPLRLLRWAVRPARWLLAPAWRVVWWVADRRGALGVGDPEVDRWARAAIRQGDLGLLLGAGAALGRFDARPGPSSTTPSAAAVVCTRDRVVPTAGQRELAEGLAAHVEEVDGDHLACVTAADHFVPALERALAAVAAS